MVKVDDKDLQIMIKAAHAGGEVLRKYFGKTLELVEKTSAVDFQTKADIESEKEILNILKENFPTYNIISEEAGEMHKDSDYTLVIDPLDGTNNFVLGLPNFSVSIALLYKQDAVAGVVYQPITNQTYSAIKGKGSYSNGKRVGVSDVSDPDKLNISYVFSYKVQKEKDYLSKVVGTLYGSRCKRVTNNWSGAFEYCILASGKIESIVTDGIELYDFAAGKLVAMEAGAKIIDFTGKPEKDYANSRFIASNSEEINKYMLRLIMF